MRMIVRENRQLPKAKSKSQYFIPIENVGHTDFIDMMGGDKYRGSTTALS